MQRYRRDRTERDKQGDMTGREQGDGRHTEETEDPWNRRVAVRGIWMSKWDTKMDRQMAYTEQTSRQTDEQAKVQIVGQTVRPTE